MGEIVHWIVEIGTLIAVGVLAGLAKYYLPSYMKEKGKNLATKEDIGSITHEIEGVKSEYTFQLEGLRASLRSRTHIHAVRYEREFEILLELSEKLVELRDSAMSLRPAADFYDSNETEEQRQKRRLDRYGTAAESLRRFTESRRPFFPEAIYNAVREVNQVAWSEAVQYSRCSTDARLQLDSDYWDKAEANAATIRRLSEECMETIRARARVWEELDC